MKIIQITRSGYEKKVPERCSGVPVSLYEQLCKKFKFLLVSKGQQFAFSFIFLINLLVTQF